MSGGSLPEPLAEGDLTRTPFAHLLLHVRQRELSGSLVVWNTEVAEGKPRQDRIRFEHGAPVAGILVERASRLDRGLLPLFARAEGPYAFYENTDLVGDSEHVRTGRVETLHLIAASLRGSSRDDAVAHVLRAFGDAPLRLRRGVDLDEFGLLPEERQCIDLLRAEPMPLQKLKEVSPLGGRAVLRLVYLLAIAKAVEAWDPTSQPARKERPSPPERKAKKREAVPKPVSEPELPPDPPADISEAHRELWLEVKARCAAIENENYFEMLGVAREAPVSAVQPAYFKLVKKWHPDRVPKELAELRPYVEAIFRHLTRAQEILSDEAERGSYLTTVQEGGGTPEADRKLAMIIQAAMEFRKVEVMMRRGELDDALELVDAILEFNADDPDYHATRGWIVYTQTKGAAEKRKEILTSLDRAIELADNHDKAHYYKGLALKRWGSREQALVHFQAAAKANPRNIEAVREVRIATMRGDTGETEKSGGKAKDSLLGKLFGSKKK